MTKQERIKDAYGKHWESIKDRVDENGWLGDIYENPYFLSGLECDVVAASFCRPISIRDIEINNGWIKIESEKDLPKTRGQEDVWVFDESGIVCAASSVRLNDPEIRRYWMKTVSHYQPIQKPEPPLF